MNLKPITLELEHVRDYRSIFNLYMDLFDSLNDKAITMADITAYPPKLSNLKKCSIEFDRIALTDYLLYCYTSIDADKLAKDYHSEALQKTKHKGSLYPSFQLLKKGFNLILTSILSSLENHISKTDYDNINNDFKNNIEQIKKISSSYKNNSKDSTINKIFDDIIDLCTRLSELNFEDISFHEYADKLANQVDKLNGKISDTDYDTLSDNAYCLKYLLSLHINLDYCVTLSYASQYTIDIFSKSENHPIIKAIYQRQTLIFKDIYDEVITVNSYLQNLKIALHENNYASDSSSLYKKLRSILTIWLQMKPDSQLPLRNISSVETFVISYNKLLSDAYILVGNYFLDISNILDFLQIQQVDLADIFGVSKSTISKSIKAAQTKHSLDLSLHYLLAASKEFIEGYSSFPKYGRFTTLSQNDKTFNTCTTYLNKINWYISINPKRFLEFFKKYIADNPKIKIEPHNNNLIKLITSLKNNPSSLSKLNDDNIETLVSLITSKKSHTSESSSQNSTQIQAKNIDLIKNLLFGNNDTVTIDKTQFDTIIKSLTLSSNNELQEKQSCPNVRMSSR